MKQITAIDTLILSIPERIQLVDNDPVLMLNNAREKLFQAISVATKRQA